MHPSRWKLTLIAWAAASAAAQAQVTAPSDAGQLPAAPAEQPAEEEDSPRREWRLPPLRITGTLSYDMRAIRSAGESSSIGHVLTGTLGTSTFIYAPWLATVSGSVGLSTSVTHSGASTGAPFNDAQAHERIRSRENFITGEGRVDLFPRSRFPMEVHFGRQDSRTDSGLASALDFQRQNIGGSIRYRPAVGRYSIVGVYNHNEQKGAGFRHSQDQISGDFNTNWKYHELALGGSHSRARDEIFDDESRFTSLVGRHTYTPSSAMSVSSTANFTRTEERGSALGDLQVMQLASIGIYHPEKSPLTLTGSVRGLVLRDRITDAGTDAAGITLGANYDVNANLRVSANGGFGLTRSEGGNSTTANAALAATYQGDSIEFRDIRYDWFASGTLGGAVGDSTALGTVTDQSLGLQVGHSASRTWNLSQRSSVSLNVNQSVSATHTRSSIENDARGSHKTLLNSVSLGWQQTGDGRTGSARASYSDSMELGGGRGRFQLFNFQLSGMFELGYGRSLTADLTYQRSQQRSSEALTGVDPLTDTVLRTRTSGISGEVAFRQNQLFGVQRLGFVSRLRLAQDVLKQPGQFLSIPDRETRLWENRLEWNIGRLSTQLELRLSQIDGRRVDSLWLRVHRNFGD
jgi:hypothetical protein